MRRALILALVMAAASALAVGITPRTYMSDQHARESLASIVPKEFGRWKVDNTIVPVPPSPDLQKALDETYDETLALTFRDDAGRRVMLSLAYGRNQHKGMNTHRPEICYPAQGFKIVSGPESATVVVGQRQVPVTRVVAAMGPRNEPITYWLLVGDQITRFGYPQRKVAISYGLQGVIPDGVLVRVSSIGPDNAEGFALQEQFIRDMLQQMPASLQPRLLGIAAGT